MVGKLKSSPQFNYQIKIYQNPRVIKPSTTVIHENIHTTFWELC